MLNLELTPSLVNFIALTLTGSTAGWYIASYYLQKYRMKKLMKVQEMIISDQAKIISELRNEKNNNR